RFARAQEVYAAVRHVLGAALARAPWLEAGGVGTRVQPLRAFTSPPSRAEREAPAARGWAPVATSQAALPLRARDAARDDAPAARAPELAPGATDAAPFFASLSYIGQLHRTYLVCETQGAPAELILVDQHAA